MARPREFDKDSVLQSIKNVFWEKGYEGASYPDLTAASGLHKGSLYAAFGDKKSLYLEALKNYDDHEVFEAVTLLSQNIESGSPSKIETLFNIIIDAVKIHHDYRGCLLCNAAIDQAPHDN